MHHINYTINSTSSIFILILIALSASSNTFQLNIPTISSIATTFFIEESFLSLSFQLRILLCLFRSSHKCSCCLRIGIIISHISLRAIISIHKFISIKSLSFALCRIIVVISSIALITLILLLKTLKACSLKPTIRLICIF